MMPLILAAVWFGLIVLSGWLWSWNRRARRSSVRVWGKTTTISVTLPVQVLDGSKIRVTTAGPVLDVRDNQENTYRRSTAEEWWATTQYIGPLTVTADFPTSYDNKIDVVEHR